MSIARNDAERCFIFGWSVYARIIIIVSEYELSSASVFFASFFLSDGKIESFCDMAKFGMMHCISHTTKGVLCIHSAFFFSVFLQKERSHCTRA